MPGVKHFQLGKKGITENFIETIKNYFKKNENIKISILKSATRNKDEIKRFEKEILNSLGRNYTARIIGFTIVLKKWRKNVRK